MWSASVLEYGKTFPKTGTALYFFLPGIMLEVRPTEVLAFDILNDRIREWPFNGDESGEYSQEFDLRTKYKSHLSRIHWNTGQFFNSYVAE